MVYHHEVLEHGDFSQRQQVVRWIRRFPFAFLSDREYTIARREFKEGDAIYACTKVWRFDAVSALLFIPQQLRSYVYGSLDACCSAYSAAQLPCCWA